jgi:hypothetical protein
MPEKQDSELYAMISKPQVRVDTRFLLETPGAADYVFIAEH